MKKKRKSGKRDNEVSTDLTLSMSVQWQGSDDGKCWFGQEYPVASKREVARRGLLGEMKAPSRLVKHRQFRAVVVVTASNGGGGRIIVPFGK